MFQSFTGSSRRPRQVNLSGRNTTNPFAAQSGRNAPSGSGPQATLAAAQQERLQRQQERDRLNASRTLQRIWRGHISRRAIRDTWRKEWDCIEQKRAGHAVVLDFDKVVKPEDLDLVLPEYASATDCLKQLRLLLHFLDIQNGTDATRLVYFGRALQKTLEDIPVISAQDEWTRQLMRFSTASFKVLSASTSRSWPSFSVDDLLRQLTFLSKLMPKQMSQYAKEYYSAMAALTLSLKNQSTGLNLTRGVLIQSVLALIQPITSETLSSYEWFARIYLTIPNLKLYLGHIDEIAADVNYKLLASALEAHVLDPYGEFLSSNKVEERIWLLAYFIYFHRYALGGGSLSQNLELEYVKVVSKLLNSAACEISQRLDLEEPMSKRSLDKLTPLAPFVRNELLSLVNPRSITGLLGGLGSEDMGQQRQSHVSEDAKVLATYALTLLRIFPRRGDEIRMWLYLGSTPTYNENGGHNQPRLPAIKYFWNASSGTEIFHIISQRPQNTLQLLKAVPTNNGTAKEYENYRRLQRDQEWTILLLFLELYTFLMKVMDDEEFFSGGQPLGLDGNSNSSWTKASALPLGEIKKMTTFLKNLAFTLYWNAVDLDTDPTNDPAAIRSYFMPSEPLPSVRPNKDMSVKTKEKTLAGVTGIPHNYFKGLVTGLLRMIHERDSRRKFLPEDHWYMTDRFDMEGFIPTVVAEEENRHQLQEDDDEDDDAADDGDDGQEDLMDDIVPQSGRNLIGTGRVQQAQRIESLRKRQQHAARRKQLEMVAPRLEILRNIPFFIPFATRVQIFREFIYRDQMRRRQGYVDPDSWRMAIASRAVTQGMGDVTNAREAINRHHAEIRRESVFEDAYEKFYELGEALKEPIQITFIDKFDTVEAGIDGGGVTKEFLTSITSEAFSPSEGLDLFVENDQNLLYPNPTAVEQRKEVLRHEGLGEKDPVFHDQVRELLKRYEFLGRVIGKCLYEGILVDVNFAGFFLLKWALTGGTSTARKESAYRANLNDVRDLDESLYQGLLQLKNYPGDVEDFALNFTVTDTIPLAGDMSSKSRTMTKELKPGGSNIPVTNQNRLVYLSYIARHRLQAQPYLQTNAFLQGLGQVIQPSWLSMFNQAELQTLVGGDSGEIDVADLRRNTSYGGVYVIGDDMEEHPTVKLFWQVMEDFPNADRRKVLKFVTSTPRAPLLGFSHLNPRFSLRDSSTDQDRLPSTSTCVNLLKLPRYTDAETLREKLLYAVSSGAGFDLS